MFLTFECVARLAPYIVGKQVHQRFLVSTRQCEIDCTNKGKTLTWIANERGVRGDLYHGQPKQIAFIGSSTLVDTLLDQKESCAEQVKSKLDSDWVHVDNYARDGAASAEAKLILDHFLKTGRRYDVILVMLHAERGKEASLRNAFHYWGQWAPRPTLLQSTDMLVRRRLGRVSETVQALFSKADANPTPPGIEPLARSNRALREANKVKFSDVPPSLTPEMAHEIKEKMQGVLKAALKVANKVYLITQPIAYDEMEHPGVAAKWFDLYPVSGRKDYYYSNKSVAEGCRKEILLMVEVAQQLDIRVIDLDAYMRPMLRLRDDMFDDKWHFAPAGAEVAAEFIANSIRPDL